MNAPNLPRLKRTVEVLALANGDVHLYRGGDDDFVIKAGGEPAVALLQTLDGGHDVSGALADLRERGLTATAEEFTAELVELRALGLVEDAADDQALEPGQLQRYDRQLRYFSDRVPPETSAASCQKRLLEASVAVLGVGGLGGAVAFALAATGVGRLKLVDGDRVELSNLNRQILFAASDLGASKVEAAAARLQALNADIAIETSAEPLRSRADVAAAVDDVDLVVDAVDTPLHLIERWVNEACFAADVPYIAMSQHPPRVRVGPLYAPGVTGCYACQEAHWRRRYPRYDDLARARRAQSSPAAALASTSLVVGGFVAGEVVQYLAGLGPPATSGRAITLNVVTMEMEEEVVPRLPGCRVCSAG